MSLGRKVMLNASVLAFGRVLGTLGGIVSIGISTRYLGVEGYAALATALAFVGIVGVLTDVGIWTIGAREIAKRPGETQRIVGGLVTAGLGLTLVAGAVGVAAVFLLYGGHDKELTRRAVLLILLTLPLSAPGGAASAFFIARQRAYMGAIASMIGNAALLIGVILAATLDLGFEGVVLAYAANGAVQALLLLAFSLGQVRLRPALDLALSKQLLGWALPLGGAALLHQVYWRIDIILLSVLATTQEVALYGLSYRVVDALVVLPQFVMVTLMPEFARLVGEHESFDHIVEKTLNVMAVGAVAVLLVFIPFAEEITGTVGGGSFEGAAGVLQILIGGVAVTYLGAIFGHGIVALNRQARLFIVTLTLLPVNVALNLILIPQWGAEGAALAFALSEVGGLAVILGLYRRYLPLPRVGGATRIALAGAGAMGFAWLLKLLPLSDVPELAVGIPAALAAYVAALYALRAMPPEVHTHLVGPVRARLRPGHGVR